MRKALLFIAVSLASIHAEVAISNIFTIGGYLTGELEVYQREVAGAGGETSNEWASEFRQQYFNFSMNGRPTEKVELRGVLAFGQTQKAVGVEEGWVTYDFNRLLRVQAGKFLVPFGTFNQLHSPIDNVFVTTPLISSLVAPSPWTDLGATFKGSVGFSETQAVSYSIFVGNGMGSGESMSSSGQDSENNRNKGYGGRLAIVPLQGLELGGSGYYDIFDDNDSQAYLLYGGDLSISIDALEIKGEYNKGKIQNPHHAPDGSTIKDGSIDGFYAQIAYTFGQLVQPHFRYDLGRYSDSLQGADRDGDGEPDGIDTSESRLCSGFAVFPTPFLVFKLEYDHKIDNQTKDVSGDAWVQAGISF